MGYRIVGGTTSGIVNSVTKTKNEVDICYNGIFTTIDKTEGFNSDGNYKVGS